MSSGRYGEPYPSWEQLLSDLGTAQRRGTDAYARHARTWADNPLVDDAMTWGEAATWSAVAVSCALAASRWAAHLLG